jgi:hypothetical protein
MRHAAIGKVCSFVTASFFALSFCQLGYLVLDVSGGLYLRDFSAPDLGIATIDISAEMKRQKQVSFP